VQAEPTLFRLWPELDRESVAIRRPRNPVRENSRVLGGTAQGWPAGAPARWPAV